MGMRCRRAFPPVGLAAVLVLAAGLLAAPARAQFSVGPGPYPGPSSYPGYGLSSALSYYYGSAGLSGFGMLPGLGGLPMLGGYPGISPGAASGGFPGVLGAGCRVMAVLRITA